VKIYLFIPHWARVVGCGPFSLCVIHKEGTGSSNEDIKGADDDDDDAISPKG
jgi:hypothetical protein